MTYNNCNIELIKDYYKVTRHINNILHCFIVEIKGSKDKALNKCKEIINRLND